MRSSSAERAGVDDDLLDPDDLVGVEIGGTDAVEHDTLRAVGRGDGAGEQWRRLALAQVTADRLARRPWHRRTRR